MPALNIIAAPGLPSARQALYGDAKAAAQLGESAEEWMASMLADPVLGPWFLDLPVREADAIVALAWTPARRRAG